MFGCSDVATASIESKKKWPCWNVGRSEKKAGTMKKQVKKSIRFTFRLSLLLFFIWIDSFTTIAHCTVQVMNHSMAENYSNLYLFNGYEWIEFAACVGRNSCKHLVDLINRPTCQPIFGYSFSISSFGSCRLQKNTIRHQLREKKKTCQFNVKKVKIITKKRNRNELLTWIV